MWGLVAVSRESWKTKRNIKSNNKWKLLYHGYIGIRGRRYPKVETQMVKKMESRWDGDYIVFVGNNGMGNEM